MSEGAQRQKPQRCVRGGFGGVICDEDRARLRAAAGFFAAAAGAAGCALAAAAGFFAGDFLGGISHWFELVLVLP